MFRYILKRFLIFIPTFFVISLMIFGLSKLAPGDPVELLLKGGGNAGNSGQRADLMASERAYQDKAHELGLDRPTFYFALSSAAYPKDLYQIKKQLHRATLSRLIDKYGNSDAVMAYYNALRGFELKTSDIATKSAFENRRKLRSAVEELYLKYEDKDIQGELENIRQALAADSVLMGSQTSFDSVTTAYKFMLDNPKTNLLYIPTIHWYGVDNQYHTWMFGDMPWLVSIDSTPYIQVETMTQGIQAKTKEADSLGRILKPVLVRSRLARQELDSMPRGLNVDSVRQALVTLEQDSARLAGQIANLRQDAENVTAQRDTIAKDLVRYTGKGFLRGDFGVSYLDSRPVATKMKEALFWTIIMNFLSIFLSYIISIPLGVQGALWKKNGLQFFTVVNYTTFFLSWLATACIAVYTLGIVNGNVFFLALVGVVVAQVVYELYAKRAYIAEGTNPVRKVWAVIYTASIAKVLLWLWIIAELLLIATIYLFVKFPILAIVILGGVAAIVALRRIRKKSQPAVVNVFDDGKGSFRFNAAGLQVRGSVMDSISTAALFVLYSLPSFWIGTILLVFLTTATYGLTWFPTGGAQTLAIAQNPDEYTALARGMDILHHMVLPILCMTYGSFAFLSRQMRGSMVGVLRQDYIRTANAKGLSEEKVVWKHAFRNSLFPIITMFGSVFPRALSGSIAIEVIYSIPGMGMLALTAITARDWPVVFTIAMLAAILTMIGNLIADMLYSVADPRVSFK